MHDPFRAQEAHRRAVDILFPQSSSIEKDISLPDITKALGEVSRRDKYIALRTLQECFEGRKKVNHWFPVMEQMIHLIIEVSSDLKEFHSIGLRSIEHYKKITQMNNIHSLHDVVFKFLAKIKNRLEEDIFIDSSASAAINDVEDSNIESKLRGCSWAVKMVDADDVDETSLKSQLSVRRQLTSFYHESFDIYRALLYKFRGNLKLSTLFQSTIQQCSHLMLEYCQKWQRLNGSASIVTGLPVIKGNLQELLRVTRRHLERLSRSNTADGLQNLNAKEIETRRLCVNSHEIFSGYVETWFKLFDIARAAKLWNEAYVAVEAINYTLSEIFPRLQPRPIYIVRYYEALAEVFWASNNCGPVGSNPPQYLYHAHALLQLWKHLSRQPNILESADYAELPGRILLAACCVFSSDADVHDGFESSGTFVANHAMCGSSSGNFQQNWTQLLGVKYPPTLSGVYRSIQSFQLMSRCSHEASLLTLVGILRSSQSSNSVSFMSTALESISDLKKTETYVQYLAPIQRNMVQAVLLNIFQCYHSISLNKICSLACLPSYLQLEGILLKAINEMRNKKFIIAIDLVKSSCNVVSQGEELFQTPVSRARVTLASIKKRLVQGSLSMKEQLLTKVKESIDEERSQTLMRLDIEERRSSAQFFEKEALRKKKLQEKQQRENEQKLLAAQQLEKERVQREFRKKQDEEETHARAKIDDLIAQLEKITGQPMPEIRSIPSRIEVLNAATARLHKEQNRVECEAIEEVNRYDFFIRAKREQECPRLERFWKEIASQWQSNASQRRQYEKSNRESVETAVLETRNRLERMTKARQKWESQILAGRQQALENSRRKRKEEEQVIDSLIRGAEMSAST